MLIEATSAIRHPSRGSCAGQASLLRPRDRSPSHNNITPSSIPPPLHPLIPFAGICRVASAAWLRSSAFRGLPYHIPLPHLSINMSGETPEVGDKGTSQHVPLNHPAYYCCISVSNMSRDACYDVVITRLPSIHGLFIAIVLARPRLTSLNSFMELERKRSQWSCRREER